MTQPAVDVVSEAGIDTDEIFATPDNAEYGYFVEVDIEYPEHLHDAHSEYPLVPEAMTVLESWISEKSI